MVRMRSAVRICPAAPKEEAPHQGCLFFCISDLELPTSCEARQIRAGWRLQSSGHPAVRICPARQNHTIRSPAAANGARSTDDVVLPFPPQSHYEASRRFLYCRGRRPRRPGRIIVDLHHLRRIHTVPHGAGCPLGMSALTNSW